MKKLLFNGCSYTAGDELVWDTYCKDILGYSSEWGDWSGKKDNVDYTILARYVKYRKQHNLGGICSLSCNTEVTDLSLDGKSNSCIAITTINYLLSLTPDERKNIHVCIGWTSPERKFIWLEPHGFQSINHHLLEQTNKKQYHSFIRGAIIDRSDFDHLLDYVSQVMLLENFLKANGITYTFWRSLGLIIEPSKVFNNTILMNNKISNNENWIKFDNDRLSINGNAWLSWLWHDIDNFISEKNKHPNLKAVNDLSIKIINHISSHSN